MKVKRTFFNSRNESLFDNYVDTNNYLFTIIYKGGKYHKEKNYILRDIKQDKKTLNYIYKKINERFDVVEINTSRMANTEYDMLKTINTPTILDCVITKPVFKKKLSETKRSFKQNNKFTQI